MDFLDSLFNKNCKSVVLFASLSLMTTISIAEDIPTRFGVLKINNENMLLYKNRPLVPPIQGNNSLSVLGATQIENNDVILIQDNGGTACPALLYFVTVSANGVKSTPAFGTCSDLIKAKRVGNTIIITMPGFLGSFESVDAKKNAANTQHEFIFDNGVVNEKSRMKKPVVKKMMGDEIDKNPNVAPNTPHDAKLKKQKKSWQDGNGFVHYPDGSVSNGPVD